MRKLLSDPRFRWLHQAWRDEMPTAMHRSVRGKGVGDLRSEVYRLLDEHFVLWEPYMTETDIAWRPGDWVMPAHEGVKRVRGREREWLVQVLGWQGLPCPCNHEHILAHMEVEHGVPAQQLEGAVLRATRQVARTVGIRHDVTVPV